MLVASGCVSSNQQHTPSCTAWGQQGSGRREESQILVHCWRHEEVWCETSLRMRAGLVGVNQKSGRIAKPQNWNHVSRGKRRSYYVPLCHVETMGFLLCCPRQNACRHLVLDSQLTQTHQKTNRHISLGESTSIYW